MTVDELERVRSRLVRLQRIAGRLNQATTVGEVVEVVMREFDASAPAASRGLWLLEPGGDALALAGATDELARAVRQFPSIRVDADLPGAVAWRERRVVVSTSRAQTEREYAALRNIERTAEGFVAVPLLLEDACLGVLGLGYHKPIDDDDIQFLEAAAGGVAQALARVRLTERERRRRDELEFLADLTDAALAAADHVELMHSVAASAVPMLGDWCTLYFLPEDVHVPEIAVGHTDPTRVAWVRELHDRYPYDPAAGGGVPAVIRTGETWYVPVASADVMDAAILAAGRDPDEIRPILDAFTLTSLITVPLRTKRRTVGAIQFASAESGRRYSLDDVALAEAVAGRLAEALDAAWLAEQQRQLAATLQRALLPPRLPAIAGVDLAARYWPSAGAEVGGDFYDVFAVDDDRWAIVIGDACGTGPNAAALTAIARHTVRAAARHHLPHAQVMDWLNEAVLLSDRDLFCTAVYATLARLDRDAWELTTTAAGHPLPIHSRPDGTALPIGRPGTLLGAFGRVANTTTTVRLHPGDVVVFYTDGVTDLPPPHGLTAEQMTDLAGELADRPTAAAIAEAIRDDALRRAPAPADQDDIAVVVLRIG